MTQVPALHVEGRASIGPEPVFGPLSLDAAAGKWTCLLGPSGAGKTTLLRLITGLDDVTEFDGTVTASDGAPLDGRVALMAQSDLLMPWLTVVENVLLGARLRGQRPDRRRAGAVLDRVGLADHSLKKPHELSGGQRQRAALARTLMEDRPFVLLDEPFSALDAGTRSRMQEMTAELLDGRTVLMVTHDPAEAARLGDAILLLSAEGLETIAPPSEPAPRRVDDPELLRVQAALLSRMRAVT